VAAPGCSSLSRSHEAKHIPQLGVVDPHQPRELRMVSMPAYVIEPPDELEIAVKPAVADLSSGNFVVQADGEIDLGLLGQVYLAGLTLDQAETRIALHLATRYTGKPPAPGYEVSVRLAGATQSKFYYVLGTVNTQGRFPVTGNETVLDAMLTAGLKSNSLPEKSYLVRPHPAGGADQVLKVDWVGIKDRGDSLTNYQIFPGDRLVVPGTRPPGLFRSLLGGG
jgi:polysaccharide export outer membrane protein